MTRLREPVKGKTVAGRRREARAKRTRARIVAAASALFLERGFAATTVEAIAAAADVAPATIYQAFGTKAAVLARVLDVAIAGDEAALPLLHRDWVTEARREPDAIRRLTLVIAGAVGISARTAALKTVMRDAAATEPAIRDLVAVDDVRRMETQRALLEIGLGHPPTESELASFYLAVNSHSYDLAASRLGWEETTWRDWLIQTLTRTLLGDPAG